MRITDQIVEEMLVWQNRPLDPLYAVLLIDCLVIKVRGSQVANRPVYVAVGVNLDGERDVLGLWLGPSGGEGAKQWATMLTELRNRGLHDALIVCCDGLKGLPESIRITWPEATVQTCVVHMVRNSLRYASKKHWGRITGQMREIYTAPTVEAAEARFAEFAGEWQPVYPAMISSWETSWEEFVPFLAFPPELRKVVYTTNAIESLNARFRRAVRYRGHFPTEHAALKVLYLVATQKRKNRQDMTGTTNGWKTILNTLHVHYGDRIQASINEHHSYLHKESDSPEGSDRSYSVAVVEQSFENVKGERRPRWRRLFPWAFGGGLALFVLAAAAAGGALPSCTDAAWGCARAHDPPGLAGSNTAIAFDSTGGAWVSFRDQDAQALLVARYVGSGGDCAGNEAWDCTVVDDRDGHDVGFETDIAFTSDGTAWVSYQDTTTDDLRVAHTVLAGTGSGCASSDWTCEVVDATNQVGGYTAIVVEGDTPLVTYWESASNDLRFARHAAGGACDAAGWSCGVVDTGSVGAYANDLALDGSGRAWAAYRYSGSGTGPNAAKLVVATHVGSGGTGCGSGSPEWSCTPVTRTGNVGLDTGIAFDGAGRPWVNYWNNQNLNLARLDPGGSGPHCSVAADWECTTVHDAADSLGEYGGIAFAADGSAWIAYHGATAKRAYVAHYIGPGAGSGCGTGSPAWACSTLDASGDVGAFWMGIAVRPAGAWGNGEPWVSYYDRSNGALKIAVLQGAPSASTAPVVSGFSPTSGPAGTPVTIDGANLAAAAAVSFAGTAAQFTVVSASQIRTTVPIGAKSGSITVVTPSGSATGTQSFRVTKR